MAPTSGDAAPSSGGGARTVRRDDLAAFLRHHREAIGPADVGLPAGHRRRAPGLRREEVAMLAGVSVTWYTWLEQGRPINASRSVLDALARTLLLDDAEHAHLLALAEDGTAAESSRRVEDGEVEGSTPPPDALVHLLDALDPNPAYLLGPRWEYLAWNRAQGALYPEAAALPDVERNLLWIVFVRPAVRRLIVGWDAEARHLLSRFRADTASRRHDPVVRDLVARLRVASPEFATWWDDQDVAGFHTRLRRYDHPVAGPLTFEFQQLTSDEWPDVRVVAQLPVPDDDSAARLVATLAP